MSESGSDRDNRPHDEAVDDDPRSRGWRDVVLTGGVRAFMLSHTHEDYPADLRSQIEAKDDETFGADPAMQAAVERLTARYGALNEVVLGRFVLGGRRTVGDLEDVIAQALDEIGAAVWREAATLGPTTIWRRRLAYIWRRLHETLPPDMAEVLGASIAPHAAPFFVAVNTGDRMTHPALYPGETAIFLNRFATRDLPKLGKVITDAQRVAGQSDRIREPGRKSRQQDPDSAEQCKIAAKLHHWRGWQHREIAQLFGWSGDRDAWSERVRKAIRTGELLLAGELGTQWSTQPPGDLARGERW